jgi:hypothetical protein
MKITENFKKSLLELSSILNEHKSEETYFDTLKKALDNVSEKTKKEGYEIVDQEREFFLFGVGGIEYGENKKKSFYLEKDEKKSKNKLHIQIYRMDSGRYELNQYIA